MDSSMAQWVVLAGGGVAVLVWLLGLRAYARLSAEPGRYRTRVAVRSAGHQALAELVRWGTQEGRRIISQAGARVCVAQGPLQVELELFQEAAGPTLEVRADLDAYRRRLLAACGLVVFGVAPLLIVGLAGGLYVYAAPSANAGTRWQAVQILQCGHALWPPFVIVSQYARLKRQLLDPIAGNLHALVDLAGE